MAYVFCIGQTILGSSPEDEMLLVVVVVVVNVFKGKRGSCVG